MSPSERHGRLEDAHYSCSQMLTFMLAMVLAEMLAVSGSIDGGSSEYDPAGPVTCDAQV